jgi:hypothetical protein
VNRIRQLLADSNFYQKKFQKKEAKLAYTLQVLNTKEKELQDMLATNRRLNDLSTSTADASLRPGPVFVRLTLLRSFFVQCSRRILTKRRRKALLSIKLWRNCDTGCSTSKPRCGQRYVKKS